jgi:Flp pilus assembly pilin Flp
VRKGRPLGGGPATVPSEGVDAVIVRTFARAKGWWHDLRRRASREFGATAVEYAIMLALIAAVIVVAVAFLGHATSSGLNSVQIP